MGRFYHQDELTRLSKKEKEIWAFAQEFLSYRHDSKFFTGQPRLSGRNEIKEPVATAVFQWQYAGFGARKTTIELFLVGEPEASSGVLDEVNRYLFKMNKYPRIRNLKEENLSDLMKDSKKMGSFCPDENTLKNSPKVKLTFGLPQFSLEKLICGGCIPTEDMETLNFFKGLYEALLKGFNSFWWLPTSEKLVKPVDFLISAHCPKHMQELKEFSREKNKPSSSSAGLSLGAEMEAGVFGDAD